MLDKFEIANALREIALLLELKQENPYKARAYLLGASAIESINEDVGRVISDGRLKHVRAIGDSLAGQIGEIYESGSSRLLDRLRSEMPPGVIELSQVPGLSVKKIQVLHDELGVDSLSSLEQACLNGSVSKVKGFGAKTQQNILDGIREYESREQQELLLDARELALRVRDHLASARGVSKVEVAGSVRRWQEVVAEITIVAATTSSAVAIKRLESFPLVSRTDSKTDQECTVRMASGIQVHLHCCEPTEFASTLLWHTGASGHVDKLCAIALLQDKEFTSHGLIVKAKVVKTPTELEIYEQLGLPFVPSEMREDEGEIEDALAGGNFDDLVRVEDIRGMTHCHTFYSDGKHSIEAMARAAEKYGMEYITITDHSPAAHYAGGLQLDRLKQQWDEIEEVQEKVKVKILRGTESDILSDGSLDYPDEILDQFDVIIASVHSRLKMEEDEMTRRLISCMKKPQFKIWGHALGRLILRRRPLACRMEEVLDVIAESRAAIEVNGDPYRLDMEPRWIREARKRGIPFIISVDAHSTGALNYIHFGVHIAQRGGLRKHEVLNTLPLEKFRQWVRPAS